MHVCANTMIVSSYKRNIAAMAGIKGIELRENTWLTCVKCVCICSVENSCTFSASVTYNPTRNMSFCIHIIWVIDHTHVKHYL